MLFVSTLAFSLVAAVNRYIFAVAALLLEAL